MVWLSLVRYATQVRAVHPVEADVQGGGGGGGAQPAQPVQVRRGPLCPSGKRAQNICSLPAQLSCVEVSAQHDPALLQPLHCTRNGCHCLAVIPTRLASGAVEAENKSVSCALRQVGAEH